MEKIFTFEFNGYEATVIRPENPNGKWIWKTEFLYAFDTAERELLKEGYTRVYYCISDMYGSPRAIDLMHRFFDHVVERFSLDKKCVLFGFSRGGLYAFNFALSHPECVDKIYLDAPVLDMRSWPPEGSENRDQVYREFGLDPDTIKTFSSHPVNRLPDFFSHGIPLLLVAGGADEIVPFEENSGILIKYCMDNDIDIGYIIKPECKHHPHSLDDVTPILDFVMK